MAFWNSKFKPGETVEILPTLPDYPQIHGATATVVLTMPNGAVIQFHSPTNARLYCNMSTRPFTLVKEQHLRAVHVPPSAILPVIATHRAEWGTGHKAVDDPLPPTIPCRRHPGAVLYLRQKNGKHWYSHREPFIKADGTDGFYWCDGRLPYTAYEGMSRRYGNCSGG